MGPGDVLGRMGTGGCCCCLTPVAAAWMQHLWQGLYTMVGNSVAYPVAAALGKQTAYESMRVLVASLPLCCCTVYHALASTPCTAAAAVLPPERRPLHLHGCRAQGAPGCFASGQPQTPQVGTLATLFTLFVYYSLHCSTCSTFHMPVGPPMKPGTPCYAALGARLTARVNWACRGRTSNGFKVLCLGVWVSTHIHPNLCIFFLSAPSLCLNPCFLLRGLFLLCPAHWHAGWVTSCWTLAGA